MNTPSTEHIVVVSDVSKEAILTHLCAELAFPDYFGFNWDALEECLSDLSWIHASVVTLRHVPPFRRQDSPTYVSILASCVAARTERPLLRVVFEAGT